MPNALRHLRSQRPLLEGGIALALMALFPVAPMALRWPVRIIAAILLIRVLVSLGSGLTVEKIRSIRIGIAWPIGLAIVLASLTLKEFYPFSNFPMYAKPGPVKDYFYVADIADGNNPEPIGIAHLTGISAPKVKKMFLSERRKHFAKNPGKDTAETSAKIGRVILQRLRSIDGADDDPQLPERIALIRVEIGISEDGKSFTETDEILATDGV